MCYIFFCLSFAFLRHLLTPMVITFINKEHFFVGQRRQPFWNFHCGLFLEANISTSVACLVTHSRGTVTAATEKRHTIPYWQGLASSGVFSGCLRCLSFGCMIPSPQQGQGCSQTKSLAWWALHLLDLWKHSYHWKVPGQNGWQLLTVYRWSPLLH